MCNDTSLFTELRTLETSRQVILGDGSSLEATGEGTVHESGRRWRCRLNKVLYLPKLAYNLLSISRAAEAGNTIQFNASGCKFTNSDRQCIALGTRYGSLFYLRTDKTPWEHANSARTEGKEMLWHRRIGHLNERSLQQMARKKLVDRLNFDPEVCARTALEANSAGAS